jgi:hypothetical protein
MISPLGRPLAPVVDHLRAELDQIESIFASCRGSSAVAVYRVPYQPSEDGCLVSMWDAWNRFIRSLCLTSCSGTTQGLSGASYHPTAPMTEAQALTHLLRNKGGTQIVVTAGEPRWYDVRALPDTTAVLGLANASVIVGAVSAYQIQLGAFHISNPLEEIRACRNFVAHKTASTFAQAQTHAGTRFPDLISHVRSKRLGVEVFSEWKEGCLAIAEAAAQ